MANALNLLGAGPGGASGTPGPPAPTGFLAAGSLESVVLNWDAQAEVTFDVYYATTSNFASATELIGDLGTNTYQHFGQPGEKYYYWVRAVGGSGASSFTGPVSGRGYVTVGNSGDKELTTPSGTWTISTILFGSNPSPIPVGVQIATGEYYSTDGAGNWFNDSTLDPSNDVPISGLFIVYNNSGGSLQFWLSDP